MPSDTETRYATAPFDDAQADLILRTSDGVHFRVHKIILSLTSRVFKDMFSLPPPTSSSGAHIDDLIDGIRVVTVSEDARTLDLALRFLYPLPSPAITLNNMATLLEISRKYEVQFHDFQLKTCLREAIEDDAVGVYALSLSYNMPDIAQRAAIATCKLHLKSLDSALLRYLTTTKYRELFLWRHSVGLALESLASSHSWWITTPGSVSATKPKCERCFRPQGGWHLHGSFRSYLTHVRESLHQGAGSACILDSIDTYAKSNACTAGPYVTRCSLVIPQTALRTFAEALSQAAEKVCSEMKMPFRSLGVYEWHAKPSKSA